MLSGEQNTIATNEWNAQRASCLYLNTMSLCSLLLLWHVYCKCLLSMLCRVRGRKEREGEGREGEGEERGGEGKGGEGRGREGRDKQKEKEKSLTCLHGHDTKII